METLLIKETEMRTKDIGLAVLIMAFVLPSLGCSSMTGWRVGQFTTDWHVAITEPGLGISAPDNGGFGAKVQIGHIQFGGTTTRDHDAKHLLLGIHSTTGFDGVENEDTFIASATRFGGGPVNFEGDLFVGLRRISVSGLAEINCDVPPAVYFDHWTGLTSAYEPFPDIPATWDGNTFDITKRFNLGPIGAEAGFSIGSCREGFFVAEDGNLDTGIGPFSLHLGASYGECTKGIGLHCFAGLVKKPCCADKDCSGQCEVAPTPASDEAVSHERHATGIKSQVKSF